MRQDLAVTLVGRLTSYRRGFVEDSTKQLEASKDFWDFEFHPRSKWQVGAPVKFLARGTAVAARLVRFARECRVWLDMGNREESNCRLCEIPRGIYEVAFGLTTGPNLIPEGDRGRPQPSPYRKECGAGV